MSGSNFLAVSLLSSQILNASKQPPWPTSPNITPNKNGKIGIAYKAGLTSWYLGTP